MHLADRGYAAHRAHRAARRSRARGPTSRHSRAPWLLPGVPAAGGPRARGLVSCAARGCDCAWRSTSGSSSAGAAQAAFAFAHNRAPRRSSCNTRACCRAALRQSDDVRAYRAAAGRRVARRPSTLLPLRLGRAAASAACPRVAGPAFGLRGGRASCGSDAPFTRRAGQPAARRARRSAGETAGKTPRRVPGSGRRAASAARLRAAAIRCRASTGRRRARTARLVTREYSEEQHLDILVAIDAGRASRVRAGVLDRLGLYANIAARLAEHAVPNDDRVGLVVFSDRTLAVCAPERGARAVTRHAARAREARDGARRSPIPCRGACRCARMLQHRGARGLAHGSRRACAQRSS